jgi:hypothetical protein
MENNIPTAEEFALKDGFQKVIDHVTIKRMQEFAKLHCDAQLKAILKKVKQEIACDTESTEHFNLSVKPSILNAYPLDLIK